MCKAVGQLGRLGEFVRFLASAAQGIAFDVVHATCGGGDSSYGPRPASRATPQYTTTARARRHQRWTTSHGDTSACTLGLVIAGRASPCHGWLASLRHQREVESTVLLSHGRQVGIASSSTHWEAACRRHQPRVPSVLPRVSHSMPGLDSKPAFPFDIQSSHDKLRCDTRGRGAVRACEPSCVAWPNMWW